MKKSILWMVLALFAFLFCVIPNPAEAAQRTIVVAVDGDWPPMKMKDGQGNLTGFEIDMIQAIGAKAGFQVSIKEVPWERIFEELDAGKVDAVIASVSITDQRKEKYDFSIPYFKVEQLLVVPKSLALIPLKGKTVAAFEATTGAAAIARTEIVSHKLYPLADAERPFKDMAEGKIDGVLCDTPVAISYAFFKDAYKKKFAIVSELSIFDKPSPKEDYGIVVKKGNAEVLDLMNRGIKALGEDYTDAWIRDRWIKW